MDKPSKQEMKHALDAFSLIEEPTRKIFDRSTLERWANCPWQAKQMETFRPVMPAIVESGSQVHHVFSEAIRQWIESEGGFSYQDMKQELESLLRASRPDLQPDVVAAAKYTINSFALFIREIHPQNVLAYDGGEAVDKGGQLSAHFDDLDVTLTGEVDLLYAGVSPELAHLMDYKSGFKIHDAQSVKDSFQFQFYAMLVMENFPDVNGVEVIIWNTRTNNRTFKILFRRDKDLDNIKARIRMAVQTRMQQHDEPEIWPTLEKCEHCPVLIKCKMHERVMNDVSVDPAGFVQQMALVELKLDAMKKAAAKVVDSSGKDIEAGNLMFGRNKPKTDRKAPATIYSNGESE